MTPVRVVLDTNCLVSALIFSHGKAGQLRAAWQRGDIGPIVCRETVTELIRVLGYPKFKLEQEDIEKLLADNRQALSVIFTKAAHVALLFDLLI